ncbi:hypothetical protein Droror1_Dr00025179 [Drosera rotundifolia]
MNLDTACLMCLDKIETSTHALGSYRVTQEIYRVTKGTIQLAQNDKRFKNWFFEVLLSSNQSEVESISTILHGVWKTGTRLFRTAKQKLRARYHNLIIGGCPEDE